MTALASGLAGPIGSLIEFKRAIGLPYKTGEAHLRAFDDMCAQDFPDRCVLTREMAMAWATARPSEHVNGQMRRITPVRQLARHMARLGVEAYVIPAGIPGRQVRYRPHIFTRDQLRALFAAADRIQPSPYGGRRDLVIPMLFRMTYCLGLRPGEARRLARNDVDLSGGTVYIRESKGHKDRRVYLSADLHGYCRTFDAAIGAHHPDRAPFFPNRKGQFYSHCSINAWFGELLQAAGIRSAAGAGAAPVGPASRARHRNHQPAGARRAEPRGAAAVSEPAPGPQQPGRHLVLLPSRRRFPPRPAQARQHRHRTCPSGGARWRPMISSRWCAAG